MCSQILPVGDPEKFKMSTRAQRDKEKKQQEEFQAILRRLLLEEDNKYCADCDAKGSFLKLHRETTIYFLTICILVAPVIGCNTIVASTVTCHNHTHT